MKAVLNREFYTLAEGEMCIKVVSHDLRHKFPHFPHVDALISAYEEKAGVMLVRLYAHGIEVARDNERLREKHRAICSHEYKTTLEDSCEIEANGEKILVTMRVTFSSSGGKYLHVIVRSLSDD